jgi:cyclophilin family peptidyl-prolyl cis-trans isomerase
MRTRLVTFCLGFFLLTALRSPAVDPIFVRFNTTLGNIDVELLPNLTPLTVANFMTYVNSGAYNNSVMHRSVPGFVIQGGGFYNPVITAQNFLDYSVIPTNPAVASETGLSNVAGTIAMALPPQGPGYATDNWFFNLADNHMALDGTADGGPFTAFGQVANASSLAVMNAIAALKTYNVIPGIDPNQPDPDGNNGAWGQVPLINYVSGPIALQYLVVVNSIAALTQTRTAWETTYFSMAQMNNSAISGPTATPQNDGVPNLLKYFYDINPSQPMSATDRAALPVLGTTTINSLPYLTLTYRQFALKTGITTHVQTSTDLQTWTTVSNPTIVQTGANATTGDPTMQVQIPASGTKQFIRLNITQP